MISDEQLKMNKLNKIFDLLPQADDEQIRKFLIKEFEDVFADLLVILKDKE